MAFIKRLLICAAQSVPPIAAGLLFLVSEILKARPTLKICLSEKHAAGAAKEKSAAGKTASAAVGDEEEGEAGFLGNFNVAKREPEFAYAPDAVPTVWELALLARHYHPSVQSFTQGLLQAPDHHIAFSGDPTVEFSLMAFLNRFAYKNPKKSALDKIKHRPASQAKEEPLNIALSHPDATADSVDPDKQFFFKYFSDKNKLVAEGRARNKSKHQVEEDRDGSDDESQSSAEGEFAAQAEGDVDSDPDEAEIDRFADQLAENLMRSAAGNAGDDDDDFDFSEEDDSDDGSAVNPADMQDGPAAGESDGEEGLEWDQGLDHSESDSDAAADGAVSSKALDFADFVAEQKGKKSKKSKGGAKSKKQAESDDDSSDDGYTGLQAYGDDDGAAGSMEVDDDGGESLLGSSGSEEGDDDDDAEESDGDEESGGEVSGDSDADSFDSAEEEALERAGFEDSDSEGAGRAKPKGKKARRGAYDDGDSAFASAEDFEEMMEEIVQKVSKPSAVATTAPTPSVMASATGKGPGKAQNNEKGSAKKDVAPVKGAQGKANTATTSAVAGRKNAKPAQGGKMQAQEQKQQGVKRKNAPEENVVSNNKPKSTSQGDKKLRKK
jgi:hypothetical protein